MTEIEQIESEIEDIERDIKRAKTEHAESEGSIKTHLNQLKKMGINSLDDARKFVSESEEILSNKDKELVEKFLKMKEKYDRIKQNKR